MKQELRDWTWRLALVAFAAFAAYDLPPIDPTPTTCEPQSLRQMPC
jgi:hypothetical protein